MIDFTKFRFGVAMIFLMGSVAACSMNSNAGDDPSDPSQDQSEEDPDDSLELMLDLPAMDRGYKFVAVDMDDDSVSLQAWDKGGREAEVEADVGETAELLGLSLDVVRTEIDTDFEEENREDLSFAVVNIVDVDDDQGAVLDEDDERVITDLGEARVGLLWVSLWVKENNEVSIAAEDRHQEIEVERQIDVGDEFELFDVKFEVVDITHAHQYFGSRPTARVQVTS